MTKGHERQSSWRARAVDALGLDAAIDDKSIAGQLAAATPSGSDAYFDNVGGEILEAVLDGIYDHARIKACGGISGYGDMANAALRRAEPRQAAAPPVTP